MKNKCLVALCLMSSMPSWGQDFPVPDRRGQRIVPNDSEIEADSLRKGFYAGELEQEKRTNKQLQREIEQLKQIKQQNEQIEAQRDFQNPPLPVHTPDPVTPKKRSKRSAPTGTTESGVQVFAVSESSDQSGEVLPAGSWVRAKLLTGVEANSQYAYEVTLQLDYAFTGPNGSKMSMQGCLMVAEAMADLSIERVIIRPRKLSCVRDSGEYVERKVAGFVAGKDSATGLQGVYSSKQGQVFLAALLASVAKGAGEAVQLSQFEETVGGSENAQVARNFKGDVGQFAVAKGATEAATMVTDWYLQRAKSLLPTIKSGSGQDVWVILTDSVMVPPLADAFD